MHTACAMAILAPAGFVDAAEPAPPIRLHPANPHYFEFRRKPAILITSGEHYGAVINLDFDFVRYLDRLKADGFNLTRTFCGTYREVTGSFGITANTLAPGPGRFVCPWARSKTPGAKDGGERFDLGTWDANYFERLRDFVREAGRRDIVVEVVLFCVMYDDSVWNASPLNARNNINTVGTGPRSEFLAGTDKTLLSAQQAVAWKIVTELNSFDNVVFEVCNEPYERSGETDAWTDSIIDAIVDAEAGLPNKHLIAQNLPRITSRPAGINRHVSILNFHAASPDVVGLTYEMNKAISFDETGGSDRSDRKYRTEGWQFIIAGGAVYDHLDFSFAVGHENGDAWPPPDGTPGGGGPALRRQLGVLMDFIHGFDFIRMRPDDAVITRCGPGAGNPDGKNESSPIAARALAERGVAYAIHIDGGTGVELTLDLPAGRYRSCWLDTKSGQSVNAETFSHAGGGHTFVSPRYTEDIALGITREPPR